jgi:GTPase involved in cell partitioning and DNA repair
MNGVVALIGNPNCGKTTLFNVLTGTYQKVGNWTGVTTEKKIGQYKKEHNMTVLQTARYNEILEKRGAQGALCGMGAKFVKKIFEEVHEESVRQQMQLKEGEAKNL